MHTRSNSISIAAFACLLATGALAQSGPPGTLGVPNVTAPDDPVRSGAAGINSAQAEATRTTGNAVRDAQATAENEEAGVGKVTPQGGVSIHTAGQGTAPAMPNLRQSMTAGAAGKAPTSEREVTRQLNLAQTARK